MSKYNDMTEAEKFRRQLRDLTITMETMDALEQLSEQMDDVGTPAEVVSVLAHQEMIEQAFGDENE